VTLPHTTGRGAGESERREVYRWFAKGVGPVKGMVTERRLGEGKVSTREVGLELVSVELAGGAKPQAAGASSANELFAQGEALAREGKHREAVAKYDAAIAADPKLAKGHAYKAISLMAQRDFEGAEKEAAKAVEMEGKEYSFVEILGQVKVGQGRVAEGKALYDKAAGMSPEHVGAVYTDLAAALAMRKDERLAGEIEAALKRAASAEPPSAEALFALGQSYVNAGRSEGKGYLQRFIEVESRLPEGKRDQTKVRLARQLIRAIDAVKG
jgi:tetratricopeptide (TPR) repeat protein